MYTVEFRIEGLLLTPSAVTHKLGLEPCQERIAGSSLSAERRQLNALWAYDGFSVELNSTREWQSLEEGLLFLLQKLLPLRDLISSNFGEFNMYWWCGHFQDSFNGGPVFSVELLDKLSEFGVPLYLENYFSDS